MCIELNGAFDTLLQVLVGITMIRQPLVIR
jgi:hypothetical protein